MFRALLWKEWRQLALVRWGGIALGVVLPLALITGAELSERGLLPNGRTTGYQARDIMYEILPAALALGLWPLIALMSAAQALGGERPAGTQSFLLDRPVSRTAIWWASVTSSLGTLLLVIAATGAIGLTFAQVSGAAPAIGWSRWWILTAAGLGVAILAWIGSAVTATMLPSPLAAVLLGAIIAALPAVMALQLTKVFPHAAIDVVPIGIVICALVPPAYVVASWAASSRGEPGGHGHVKRGISVTLGALLTAPALFAMAAPVAMRVNAARGLHEVVSSPSGTMAVVGSRAGQFLGSWMVSVPRGRRVRFLAPAIDELVWNPDGTRLGVATWSGPLGSDSTTQRIEVYDTREGSKLRSLPAPRGRSIADFVIRGEALAAVVYGQDAATPTSEVFVAHAASREWIPTGFRRERSSVRLIGSLRDGRIFVREIVWRSGDGQNESAVYHYYPLDLDAAKVGSEILAGDGGSLIWEDARRGGLSPSGKFEITTTYNRRGYDVLESATGNVVSNIRSYGPPQWLADDRLAWLEPLADGQVLCVGAVGEVARVVRAWTADDVTLRVSPDGEAILVSALPSRYVARPNTNGNDLSQLPLPRAAHGKVPEEIVYIPRGRRIIELDPSFADSRRDIHYSRWAGPRTLARIAPGVVYFEDIDAPGERRFVIGGAGDIE
jgi:hypothetical protein